jgi:peptidoglycan hydrolase-like protein with peptidoglycan-binding domain
LKTKEFLEKISLPGEFIQIEKISWDRNLTLGMRGNDVKKLQEILISEGVWPRPDIKPTGYFGSITQAAVIRFQEKHFSEILEPLGLKKGTGFVGPSTRAYLKTIE